MPSDSSRENRREEKKELLNNSTTIHLIRSFSIPIEKVVVLTKFCEIARREAGSRGFSEVLVKAIEEYVKNHEEGNPQLKLTPYIDEKASSPTYVLCNYIDGVVSNGKIHCRRAAMWIKGLHCYACENNRLRKNSKADKR